MFYRHIYIRASLFLFLLVSDGMCDGMNISRRLMLIGVMLIVLSMTMATQYVTTEVGYRYNIVHPSEADIRFIGSDNSSDGIRILRMTGANTTTSLELVLGGNISAGQNKTFTCAFGIVNEEQYPVNITHINVSATIDHLQIWLHGNRTQQKESDPSAVKVWDKGGAVGYGNGSTAWVLAAGDGNPSTMCDNHNQNGAAPQLDTPWDTSALVRVSTNTNNDSMSGVSDFVWVQISIDVPATATQTTYTGTIFIFIRAGT